MCHPKPSVLSPGLAAAVVPTLLGAGVVVVVVVVVAGGLAVALVSLAGSVGLVALTLWAAHRLSVRLWGRSSRRSPAPPVAPLLVAVRAWVDDLPGVWPSDRHRRLRPAARSVLPVERLALEPSRVWTGEEWSRGRGATLGGDPGHGLTPP